MAEIVWSKDGQGEFDFDYLLNLTNQNFVGFIENRINQDYFKSIKIIENRSSVEVIVANTWGVRIYDFDRINKRYEATAINTDDLVWALNVIQSSN